jgi:hypothetical protein
MAVIEGRERRIVGGVDTHKDLLGPKPHHQAVTAVAPGSTTRSHSMRTTSRGNSSSE